MPRSAQAFPIAIYFPADDQDQSSWGIELRRFAELGLAAVGVEPGNPAPPGELLAALRRHLAAQQWARTNAIAWVECAGAKDGLAGAVVAHPELQPDLWVRPETGSPGEPRLAPSAENRRRSASVPMLPTSSSTTAATITSPRRRSSSASRAASIAAASPAFMSYAPRP